MEHRAISAALSIDFPTLYGGNGVFCAQQCISSKFTALDYVGKCETLHGCIL